MSKLTQLIFAMIAIPGLALAIAVPGRADKPDTSATMAACPDNATPLRGRRGSFTCSCSAAAAQSGPVWGSGAYSDDSRICRAAVHAGMISTGGGVVTFSVGDGRTSYQGSARNGVTSGNWGRWDGSFAFESASQPSDTVNACPRNAAGWRGSNGVTRCSCSAQATRSGSVWGDGVYSDDSNICRAAVHAGVLSLDGGIVLVEVLPGRASYPARNRNGVSSGAWGRWAGSFAFNR